MTPLSSFLLGIQVGAILTSVGVVILNLIASARKEES